MRQLDHACVRTWCAMGSHACEVYVALAAFSSIPLCMCATHTHSVSLSLYTQTYSPLSLFPCVRVQNLILYTQSHSLPLSLLHTHTQHTYAQHTCTHTYSQHTCTHTHTQTKEGLEKERQELADEMVSLEENSKCRTNLTRSNEWLGKPSVMVWYAQAKVFK